jgi:hypothetical protein
MMWTRSEIASSGLHSNFAQSSSYRSESGINIRGMEEEADNALAAGNSRSERLRQQCTKSTS